MHRTLCLNISKKNKIDTKSEKSLDTGESVGYNKKKLIEVAETMISSLHTPASGFERKAIPPKQQFGCRRLAVGIVSKRYGTVAHCCVEGYQRDFVCFVK